MKRSIILFIVIGVALVSSTFSQVQAWPEDNILVQQVEISPKIDGNIDDTEWDAGEDLEDIVSYAVGFDGGPATEITFNVIILRNVTHIFFLVKFDLNDDTGYEGNASIGIAISDNEVVGMPSSQDRKIIYHNANTSQTETFDLHNCELSACTAVSEDLTQAFRDRTPGKLDTTNNLEGAYGDDGSTRFFEVAFPLLADDEEDVSIVQGTHVKIVINPYLSIWHDNVGHANQGTNNLEILLKSDAFIERPEGPMDVLAKVFTGLFSLIIIGMSLLLLVSARYDKFAERFLRVNITEKMANESVLMEIGYYNSSFISLFSLFYFWLFSLVTVVYGWWANWALVGVLINGPALVISTYTMYDLVKRNHNPQDLPEEERRKLGREVEETNALWIFPPLFLGSVLFMLVFIGIDVIT